MGCVCAWGGVGGRREGGMGVWGVSGGEGGALTNGRCAPFSLPFVSLQTSLYSNFLF